MSLGQIMFDSRTIAILLSHLMNFFCLAAIYRIARFWLQPAYALIAALIPFTTPYFGFHSLVDEKIDLAFTFIVLSSFLLLITPMINGWFGKSGKKYQIQIFRSTWKISTSTYLLLLTGWIGGFAFGIKYTALFYLIALICTLFYNNGKRNAFAGALLLSIGSIFLLKIYRLAYLPVNSTSALILGLALTAVGVVLIFYSYKNNWSKLRAVVLQSSCIIGMAVLAYSPWIVKNISEHKALSIHSLTEGKELSPPILLTRFYDSKDKLGGLDHQLPNPPYHYEKSFSKTTQIHQSPQAKFIKQGGNNYVKKKQLQETNATQQAAKEEIKRYLGYEPPFWLYSSLAYDMSMNVNIPNLRYLDVGFLFLLFIPLLLLIDPTATRPLWAMLLLVAVAITWLALTLYSIYAPTGQSLELASIFENLVNYFNQHPGGNDSIFRRFYAALLGPILWLANQLGSVYRRCSTIAMEGIVTILLFFVGCLYLLLRNRLREMPQSFKLFLGFLLVYLLLWWLLGNAIIWYAMPLFVILPIVFVYLLQFPEKFMGVRFQRFSSIFIGLVLGLSLGINTLTYFTSSFPGDVDQKLLFRWPFVDFMTSGKTQEQDVLKYFNPLMKDALDIMNTEEYANIYKVNTHYGFHIKANDVRVFNDPVLEKFNFITSRLDDDSEFFDVLKANDFKYILFDLRTGSVDSSPEKSLRKKFINLADLLVTSNKVQLLITDNYVQDPNASIVKLPNGKKVNARQGLLGQTISLGNFALFEIR